METAIHDLSIYLHRMQKSVLDKMFFIDKVFEPFSTIVDFGCANGELIKALQAFFGEYTYIGYDLSHEMIEAAKENVKEAAFFTEWDKIDTDFSDSLINISSTIHEVYSYSAPEDVELFWKRVFESGFKYITIRDMMLAEDALAPADPRDLEKIRTNFKFRRQLEEYESIWGPVQTKKDLVHYLLKYSYTQNWDREVRENYVPLTLEDLHARIPTNYEITYETHFILPYTAWQIKRDFDIDLTIPTHIKIILKRK